MSNDSTGKTGPLSLALVCLAEISKPSPLDKLFEHERLAAAQSKRLCESLEAELRRRNKAQGLPTIVEPFPAELAHWVKSGELALKAKLSVDYLLWLEHPTDKVARESLRREIDLAIKLGDLPELLLEIPDDGYLPGVEYFTRLEHLEPYRAWREKCPASLLSERTKIHKWLGAMPAIESTPVAPIPPAKPNAKPKDTDDGIALVGMENAALIALRKELKREPDFDEFWHYLTTRDDTGTVADCTDDRLYWIGKASSSCDTAKSTIRNRLTKAKKRNPYTPS